MKVASAPQSEYPPYRYSSALALTFGQWTNACARAKFIRIDQKINNNRYWEQHEYPVAHWHSPELGNLGSDGTQIVDDILQAVAKTRSPHMWATNKHGEKILGALKIN